MGEFPNQLKYKKLTKIWSETMVFSSQLRLFPQIIIALDIYTAYMGLVPRKPVFGVSVKERFSSASEISKNIEISLEASLDMMLSS